MVKLRVNIKAPFYDELSDSGGLEYSREAEEESKLSSVRDGLYRYASGLSNGSAGKCSHRVAKFHASDSQRRLLHVLVITNESLRKVKQIS
jgi:hypothetical protein